MTWQLCAWLSRTAGQPVERPVLLNGPRQACWRCQTDRWAFTRHSGMFSVLVCGTCGAHLASSELTACGPTAWVDAGPRVSRTFFGQPLVLVTAPKPPDLGELRLTRDARGEWLVSITIAAGSGLS